MEAYVTREEFDKALKCLNNLIGFLEVTFGAKFVDYCKDKTDDDDIVEVKHLVSTCATEGTPMITSVRGNNGTILTPDCSLTSGEEQSIYFHDDPLRLQDSRHPFPTINKAISVGGSQPEPSTFGCVPSPPPIPLQMQTVRPLVCTFATAQRVNPTSPQVSSNLISSPPNVRVQEQQSTSFSGRTIPVSPLTQSLSAKKPVKMRNSKKKTSSANPKASKRSLGAAVAIPVEVQQPTFINPEEGSNERSKSISKSSNPNRQPPLPSFRKKRSFSLQEPGPGPSSDALALPVPPGSSSDNEIIECDKCHLFIYASQVDAHQNNHTKLTSSSKVVRKRNSDKLLQQPQMCPLCHLRYDNFAAYEEHCSEHHPNDKPCPLCDKVLKKNANLKKHIMIHGNLKFICDICGKGYNRCDNLFAHKKIHVRNETPSIFYCGQCGLAFSSKKGRDTHLVTSHDISPHALVTAGVDPNMPEELSAEEEEEDGEQMDTHELNSPAVERIKVDGGANNTRFEYEGDED